MTLLPRLGNLSGIFALLTAAALLFGGCRETEPAWWLDEGPKYQHAEGYCVGLLGRTNGWLWLEANGLPLGYRMNEGVRGNANHRSLITASALRRASPVRLASGPYAALSSAARIGSPSINP